MTWKNEADDEMMAAQGEQMLRTIWNEVDIYPLKAHMLDFVKQEAFKPKVYVGGLR
jgi:hypothetical protein